MKTLSYLALLALSFVLFAPASMRADPDEDAITQRILQRVGAIDAFKLAGKIGENNAGLLEQRGPLKPDETKTMNDENNDRRSLYTILAKRLGLTMTVVGQGRAEDLRNRSAPGVWLQDKNGAWYKK